MTFNPELPPVSQPSENSAPEVYTDKPPIESTTLPIEPSIELETERETAESILEDFQISGDPIEDAAILDEALVHGGNIRQAMVDGVIDPRWQILRLQEIYAKRKEDFTQRVGASEIGSEDRWRFENRVAKDQIALRILAEVLAYYKVTATSASEYLKQVETAEDEALLVEIDMWKDLQPSGDLSKDVDTLFTRTHEEWRKENMQSGQAPLDALEQVRRETRHALDSFGSAWIPGTRKRLSGAFLQEEIKVADRLLDFYKTNR